LSADAGGGSQSVLVLGDAGGLGEALARRLEQGATAVERAMALSDSQVSALLAEHRWSAVVVVTREDVLALRLTLLVEHLRPDLALWVTMFDRTIARELHHEMPAVQVISPAELVAADVAEKLSAAVGKPVARGRTGMALVDDALRLLVRAGAGIVAAS
jgi:dTDP-4-dehydrorhamnose reductase